MKKRKRTRGRRAEELLAQWSRQLTNAAFADRRGHGQTDTVVYRQLRRHQLELLMLQALKHGYQIALDYPPPETKQ